MKKHFKYLKYLAKHKYFVLVAGYRLRLTRYPQGLFRLLVHDWTKFLPSEWLPYVEAWYGEYAYDYLPYEVEAPYERAWSLHQHRNDHHWQNWVLTEDTGEVKVLEMDYFAALEMVSDWAGAGKAIHGRWDLKDWYENNKHIIKLGPATKVLVERAVKAF